MGRTTAGHILFVVTITLLCIAAMAANHDFCKNKKDGHYCAKCRSKFLTCSNGKVINRHDCQALDCVQDLSGSRRTPYAECGTLNYCELKSQGRSCDGPYSKRCENGKLKGYTFLPNSCFSDENQQQQIPSSSSTLSSHENSENYDEQQNNEDDTAENESNVELLYSAENDVIMDDQATPVAAAQAESDSTAFIEPDSDPRSYEFATKLIQGAGASTLSSEFFASVSPAIATNEPCKNKVDGSYCMPNVTNSILNCVRGAGILSHCPALTSCNQTSTTAAQCVHVSQAAYNLINGGMFIYYAVPIIGLALFGLFTIGIFICSLAITLSG